MSIKNSFVDKARKAESLFIEILLIIWIGFFILSFIFNDKNSIPEYIRLRDANKALSYKEKVAIFDEKCINEFAQEPSKRYLLEILTAVRTMYVKYSKR